MINKSAANSNFLINEQIKIIEKLNSCLFKAEALINLGTNANFLELPHLTIYQYLIILREFIDQAGKHCYEALDLLLSK